MEYGCPQCGKGTADAKKYDEQWIHVGPVHEESIVCSWECVAALAAEIMEDEGPKPRPPAPAEGKG